MQTLSYPTRKYVILHGHAQASTPVLLAYKPPSKISTGQPNIEPFDDPQAAIDRAIELGVPALLTDQFWPHDKSFNLVTDKLVDLSIEDYNDGKTYAAGDVVYVSLEAIAGHWLKISTGAGEAPGSDYDIEAGTGDWVPFYKKPAPPEPTAEQKLAALEARLKALEAA